MCVSFKIFYHIIVQEGTLRRSNFVQIYRHKALIRSIITMPARPGNLMHIPLPRTDRNFPRRTLQSAMVDRHKIMQERSRENRNYENEDIRNNEQDEAQHRK